MPLRDAGRHSMSRSRCPTRKNPGSAYAYASTCRQPYRMHNYTQSPITTSALSRRQEVVLALSTLSCSCYHVFRYMYISCSLQGGQQTGWGGSQKGETGKPAGG
jgi:hypothetical protein